LTILLTVLAGIAVFVSGQIVQKWFIDPIQEQRKLIGEVLYCLAFYAYVRRDLFPPSQVLEAHTAIRGLSAQLFKALAVIPCYRFLGLIHVVHKRTTIIDTAVDLVAWSNSMTFPENAALANRIITRLGLRAVLDVERLRRESL
jgi:hypothetical protein